MYFYLIVALQGFCIYHLYKNRNSYYWYFVIVFIPVIGSIIYLITQVFNKRDVENIQNEITTIINPTKKIRDLEKTSEFADTFQNRVNVADAYFEISDFSSAALHYNKALDEHPDNDAHVHKMLINCYSELDDYQKIINHVEQIKDLPDFKKSRSQFFYGLALDKMGKPDEAEIEMKSIDQRYSNYDERVILAKFLLHRDKTDEAKGILNEILIESEHMNKDNKRLYKMAIVETKKLLGELNVN